MRHTDFCIAGGGIIGLTLALELHRCGATVTVIERGHALGQASQAAAGMLAAHDPDNPPALLSLSELSLALYPDLLARIDELSGQKVPFQTAVTWQSSHETPSGEVPQGLVRGSRSFLRLAEHSIDPRQLAPALLAAVRATPVRLVEHNASDENEYATSAGIVVSTLGAWGPPPVAPRKGQMLAVRIPAQLPLDYVVRTPDIYIVPRTTGPRAGQAVIGATVEDAGFTTHTEPASLHHLRRLASALLPVLGDETAAPMLDHWAGLRPWTPNHLPVLGEIAPAQAGGPRRFLATGHYRNGILLAPATAQVMAALLLGETPAADLTPFSPHRFGRSDGF